VALSAVFANRLWSLVGGNLPQLHNKHIHSSIDTLHLENLGRCMQSRSQKPVAASREAHRPLAQPVRASQDDCTMLGATSAFSQAALPTGRVSPSDSPRSRAAVAVRHLLTPRGRASRRDSSHDQVRDFLRKTAQCFAEVKRLLLHSHCQAPDATLSQRGDVGVSRKADHRTLKT